jgi:hypothetical protein
MNNLQVEDNKYQRATPVWILQCGDRDWNSKAVETVLLFNKSILSSNFPRSILSMLTLYLLQWPQAVAKDLITAAATSRL